MYIWRSCVYARYKSHKNQRRDRQQFVMLIKYTICTSLPSSFHVSTAISYYDFYSWRGGVALLFAIFSFLHNIMCTYTHTRTYLHLRKRKTTNVFRTFEFARVRDLDRNFDTILLLTTFERLDTVV